MSPAKSRALQEHLDQELAAGKIVPSKSPIAAPCFLVKKADGSLQLVVDYQKLNAVTIPDCYPLPLQQELIHNIAISMAKYYTKLDLCWGFNYIPMAEEDDQEITSQELTAFITKYALYESRVMPFRFCNALAACE